MLRYVQMIPIGNTLPFKGFVQLVRLHHVEAFVVNVSLSHCQLGPWGTQLLQPLVLPQGIARGQPSVVDLGHEADVQEVEGVAPYPFLPNFFVEPLNGAIIVVVFPGLDVAEAQEGRPLLRLQSPNNYLLYQLNGFVSLVSKEEPFCLVHQLFQFHPLLLICVHQKCDGTAMQLYK